MTNRTATTRWRNLRRRLLTQAQANGITHCPLPGCGVPLDYTTGMKPNSATPDHIEHWTHTQDDSAENIQIICRHCNSADGGRIGRQIQQQKVAQHVQPITF